MRYCIQYDQCSSLSLNKAQAHSFVHFIFSICFFFPSEASGGSPEPILVTLSVRQEYTLNGEQHLS